METVLNEIVKLLQSHPDPKLRIEGHTDNQGNAAANQALSGKRAQSVLTWLTGHGIAATRLAAKGYGQTKPIADNSTDDGRGKKPPRRTRQTVAKQAFTIRLMPTEAAALVSPARSRNGRILT